MVTAQQIAEVGTSASTNPGNKNSEAAKLQAVINLTDVLKLIGIVLIDIRDGKKSG